MILASVGDYMYEWQLPIILAFVSGSVFVGGWTLYKVFRKRGQKLTLGRSILGVVLAELGGGMVGGAVFMAVKAFQSQTLGKEFNAVSMVITSALAIPVFLFGFIHILHIMFALPWKAAAKMALWPLLTIFAFGVVLGAAAGIPSMFITWGQREREACVSRLKNIHGALQTYRDTYRALPPNLDLLLTAKVVEKSVLRCLHSGSRETGFFYLPPPANSTPDKNAVEACDWKGNHSDYRAVLMLGGEANWLSEAEFQALLGNPVNQPFSRALAEAEEAKKR